jgi:hypothetical protein
MARSTADRLAGYQRRYRTLAAQLADIGYIAAESLAQRHNRCGKPNCHCHGGLDRHRPPAGQRRRSHPGRRRHQSRQAGASWSAIGAKLGVSRRGAQQRFTRASARESTKPATRAY